MSISRTILSRPRRSHDASVGRAPGRLAIVATILLAVSACTAVAADGLPSATEPEPGVEATGSEPDVEATGSEPDVEATESEPATVPEPAAGVGATEAAPPVVETPAQPASPTTEDPAFDAWRRSALGPTAPDTLPIPGPLTDRGTIVAHATASTVVARQRPAADAEPVADFANPTDRGGPLVFQAVGEPRGGWLEVLLPVRPNGTTGWVEVDDVTLTRNPYRIEVDLETYELTVRRLGEIEISAPVAIGQGGTPTPIGDFYLIELLQPRQPNGPYGSYAYGLSGYSDVLDNFNGGDGVIGIHGTNRPELLGGPASHGCIRIHNDTIELMAEFLPLGTPVSIIEATTGR